MSLSEEQERQLLSLVGRVAELENKEADFSSLVTLTHFEGSLPIPKRCARETLTGNRTIKITDPTLIVFNCNGGNRTIFLPSPSEGSKYYVFINNSS